VIAAGPAPAATAVTVEPKAPAPVSERFADLYLHFATITAMAPALLVAVGMIAPRLGLMTEQFGMEVLAFQWAPRIALSSVAAGLFGVIVVLVSGFSHLWLRALLALAITTATLFAYVWDREVRRPAPAHELSSPSAGQGLGDRANPSASSTPSR
jgi:hypothetical protein